MSFFDVPIPETPDREPRYEQPEWAAPPRGVVPGYSAERAILFKDEKTLLLVHRILVYPTGVEFALALLMRDRECRSRRTEIRQRTKDAEVIWPG